MDGELAELSAFINKIPPFDLLPNGVVLAIVKELNICYLRAGKSLPPEGIERSCLYILRKGALVYSDANEQLIGKYGEGDICTVFCHTQNPSNIKVHTEEDTLLYSIEFAVLSEILKPYSAAHAFFMQTAEQRLNERMNQANEEAIIASTLMNTPISQFYHSPVATIDHNQSIQQAAIEMTALGFSCLVVTEAEQPKGIITDKDIRRRCVAQGLGFSTPVSAIMTSAMTSISASSSAYDALMLMTSKHIHHLPVIDSSKLIAMVTITDLMNNEGQNAANITSIIHKANTIDDLSEISKLLPKLQIRLSKLGTTADHVGKSISAITMAFTIRLIQMAEDKYGKAPVPYAWLAAGSQARQEQLAHSDQDNALIISDELKPEDEPWFENVSHFVCDGLAACGFVHCPGDIMATNVKWRKTQRIWHKYFDQWVNTPSPKALLNSSVFFDLTTVYGDENLLLQVRERLLKKTKGSTLFLAHLSKNALALRPPLGFFRDFVLISDGENKASLDLKHNGIAPIVDLARIYALAEGISSVNTIERLQLAAGTPSLTRSSAANLIDAYQFLCLLRMGHQAKRLQENKSPNNYLSPKALSKLEREHLKDAFKVIKTLQDSRQATY